MTVSVQLAGLLPELQKASVVPERTASPSLISPPPQPLGPSPAHPQYLGFWRGQLAPGVRASGSSLAGPRGTTGGGRGLHQPVASPAACQLPAVHSVLLGRFRTGAPERAELVVGPHHKALAVCGLALPPHRTSVLPLGLWASLGEGPRGLGCPPPRSTGHWASSIGCHLGKSWKRSVFPGPLEAADPSTAEAGLLCSGRQLHQGGREGGWRGSRPPEAPGCRTAKVE